jgi:hypothetical protein
VEVAHLATAHLIHQATTLLVSPAAIDVHNYSLALPIEAVLPFFLSLVEEHFGQEISSQHITAEEYQLRDCLSPQHQF